MKNIPFNKTFIANNSIDYLKEVVENGKLSGNGKFTKLCHNFFEKSTIFQKFF